MFFVDLYTHMIYIDSNKWRIGRHRNHGGLDHDDNDHDEPYMERTEYYACFQTKDKARREEIGAIACRVIEEMRRINAEDNARDIAYWANYDRRMGIR